MFVFEEEEKRAGTRFLCCQRRISLENFPHVQVFCFVFQRALCTKVCDTRYVTTTQHFPEDSRDTCRRSIPLPLLKL